jgi:ribosomal protein S18 acetylase RimI-like enzyme
MNVRSFQLSDYAKVTLLLSEVLTEACYEETMDVFAGQLSLDSEMVMVAEDSEQIVGIVIGMIDNNEGYFYRIAVASQHQRKGIGKSMVEALKHRFMQRKVRRILVTVDTHNEPILSLYESVGYRAADFSRSRKHLRIVNV